MQLRTDQLVTLRGTADIHGCCICCCSCTTNTHTHTHWPHGKIKLKKSNRRKGDKTQSLKHRLERERPAFRTHSTRRLHLNTSVEPENSIQNGASTNERVSQIQQDSCGRKRAALDAPLCDKKFSEILLSSHTITGTFGGPPRPSCKDVFTDLAQWHSMRSNFHADTHFCSDARINTMHVLFYIRLLQRCDNLWRKGTHSACTTGKTA